MGGGMMMGGGGGTMGGGSSNHFHGGGMAGAGPQVLSPAHTATLKVLQAHQQERLMNLQSLERVWGNGFGN